LAEHPSGLWLVEQHIAHERFYMSNCCKAGNLSPRTPVILNQLSPAQRSQLQRIGLEVNFGDQLWAVRKAPALCKARRLRRSTLELSWGGDLQAAQVATACRSAIRNGTPLSLQEMQTL